MSDVLGRRQPAAQPSAHKFPWPSIAHVQTTRRSQYQRMNCGPTHFRQVVTRRLPAIRSLDHPSQVPTSYGLQVANRRVTSTCIPQQFRTTQSCILQRVRVFTCFPRLVLRQPEDIPHVSVSNGACGAVTSAARGRRRLYCCHVAGTHHLTLFAILARQTFDVYRVKFLSPERAVAWCPYP
jgi:hypothetical protein